MSRVSDDIRQNVRQRANDRCEYCHKPDILSTYGNHVDHIVPLVHGGTSEPDNLAWACLYCNVAKGRDIASYDFQTGLLVPLYNPRTDQWDDHFSLDGAVIIGKTAVGRVTVRILGLNHVTQLDIRAELIEAGLWPE